MVVDFHTHIFPEQIASRTLEKLSAMSHEPYYTGATIETLFHSMKQGGVDLSIALPVVTAPKQFDSINRFAAQVNATYYDAKHHTGILSFGGIHPDCEDYKGKLRQIADMGFRGIKLHPVYQQVQFDDLRYLHIVDYASELGLVTVTHAGYDVGFPGADFVSPAAARRLIDAVHPEQLVLAHVGGYDQWEEVEELLIGQDVYFDLAFSMGKMSDDQLVRMIRSHGADRFLFATDSPWLDQKEQVAYLDALPLTEKEKQQIYGENAMKLLQARKK